MKWYFHAGDDGAVHMRARATGPGGLVGDAFDKVEKGGSAYGVAHKQLLAAGAGVLAVDRHGKGRIMPERRRKAALLKQTQATRKSRAPEAARHGVSGRTVGRLSSLKVRNAKPPKGKDAALLTDGGNLLLQVTRGAGGNIRRSWLFRYQLDGKRHDVGLGPLHDVSLADARDTARAMRAMLRNGDDPLDVKRQEFEAKRREREQRAAEDAKAVTFDKCAQDYLRLHSDGWRNPKHRAQWASTLATYAHPVLGHLAVGDVDVPHVVQVLTPIWTAKHETARRVLNRIERVLNYAIAAKLRDGPNPARWAGNLKDLLPSGGSKVEHHPALPYTELPQFMAELRQRNSLSARALEFTVLTAARTGETIGATWSEIDLKNNVWTIPAERMKAQAEHKVPLSDRAVAILRGLKKTHGQLFPLSNMAMLQLLRGMKPGVTTHGMRSAFMDWAHERTNFPKVVVDKALAHAIDDKVEAAYRRGDLFQKRAKLMQQWADYCARPATAEGKVVVPLRKAGER